MYVYVYIYMYIYTHIFQRMSDRPRNPGDDFPGYFQNLRVSAQPFVPNVNASVFQPGGYPGNQMYGGPYNVGGLYKYYICMLGWEIIIQL